MDEGGKTTDQELLEALILIRSDFGYLCSPRGLIIPARPGGNPGPEKDAPGCPSFGRRLR